jgi:hypothetical protein
MTLAEHATLTEWQKNRHLPPEVRLESDFDALLDVVEFALNAPPCPNFSSSAGAVKDGESVRVPSADRLPQGEA